MGGLRPARIIIVEASPLLGFLAGLAAGRLGYEPPSWLPAILLSALVYVAGFEIGYTARHRLRMAYTALEAGLGLAAVALVSALLVGAALAPLSGLAVRESLAVTLASGWYTLAAPVLAACSPYAGAVGLLANMFREVLHIALYPVLARRGLRVEAVAAAGATAMDTGLPVIALYGGADAAAAATVQGLVLTLIAPLLVPAVAGC